jgi:hypothetical protein
MTEKPTPVANIDGLSRLVESAMGRATTPLPASLITQTGGMLRHCLRRHLVGNPAHPGIAKMAKMGKCSERQARRNLRVLEAWGVLSAAAYPKGGRWATRYWVEIDAIKQTLIALGCNPSRNLVSKMGQVWADMRADKRGGKCPDKCPDTMSAGILYIYPSKKTSAG